MPEQNKNHLRVLTCPPSSPPSSSTHAMYSPPRGQIPHVFAYRPRRSVSSASGKRIHTRTPDACDSSQASLLDPMWENNNDNDDDDELKSQITPLWAMGTFVTSSSFSRTPECVQYSWHPTKLHTRTAAFPSPSLEFTPMEVLDELRVMHSLHHSESATTKFDKPAKHETSASTVLTFTRSHTLVEPQVSQSLDMHMPMSVSLHRRSKSYSGLKGASQNQPTPMAIAEIDPLDKVAAMHSRIGSTASHDDLASMADAAAMALRRRTRSAPNKGIVAESLGAADTHGRSTSLGGQRLSRSESVTLKFPPVRPLPLTPSSTQSPSPPTITTRSSPPIRAPPPPTLQFLPAFAPLTPPRSTDSHFDSEMYAEAIMAIREAEEWHWPVPPAIARRLSPAKLFLPPPPPRHDSLSSCSVPLGQAPHPFAAAVTQRPVFSWEANSRSSSTVTSLELPRNSSSAVSSELALLTPDEALEDPFECTSPTSIPPPLPPRTSSRKYTRTMTPSRYGVPF